MANEEHLNILMKGVEAWNKWRRNNPEIIPDLRGVNLQGMYLECINFENTNLTKSDLRQCKLQWARFNGAILDGVDLEKADLSGTNIANYLKQKREREKILEAHETFLQSRNLPSKGVQYASKRHSRTTHCWNCKGHLDNSSDLECSSCGWIICRCGACGCGYSR